MKFRYTARFLKDYSKLPKNKQGKVDKQLKLLEKNFYHPSLRAKKVSGRDNTYEFRIDYHYRMTAEKISNELILRTVGSHDEGLGKK